MGMLENNYESTEEKLRRGELGGEIGIEHGRE